MKPKPIYASKTFWVNIVALVASVGTAFGLDLGLDAETQMTIALGILAGVNVFLRAVTTKPVKIKPNAKALALLAIFPLLGACANVGDALTNAADAYRAGKDWAVEKEADAIRNYCRSAGAKLRTRHRAKLADLGVHIDLWTEDGACPRLE